MKVSIENDLELKGIRGQKVGLVETSHRTISTLGKELVKGDGKIGEEEITGNRKGGKGQWIVGK